MLTLTRRMDESLLISETACLRVRDRRGDLVLISVLTACGVQVEIDGTPVEPAGTPHTLRWHLHWLLCGESLRIGDAVIHVGEAVKRQGSSRGGKRQIRIAIEAPRSLAIVRADDLRTALNRLGGVSDHIPLDRDAA